MIDRRRRPRIGRQTSDDRCRIGEAALGQADNALLPAGATSNEMTA